MESILRMLRSNGWVVAVHNDYQLDGKSWTFWLFTNKRGQFVKGEGPTDKEALTICYNAAINTTSRYDKLEAALEALLFSAVSREHGRIIAEDLVQNRWIWPDDTPRVVSPAHEQARTVLATEEPN